MSFAFLLIGMGFCLSKCMFCWKFVMIDDLLIRTMSALYVNVLCLYNLLLLIE